MKTIEKFGSCGTSPNSLFFIEKKEIDAIVQFDISHVSFKYIIRFALPIWEKAYPAFYLDGNTIRIF